MSTYYEVIQVYPSGSEQLLAGPFPASEATGTYDPLAHAKEVAQVLTEIPSRLPGCRTVVRHVEAVEVWGSDWKDTKPACPACGSPYPPLRRQVAAGHPAVLAPCAGPWHETSRAQWEAAFGKEQEEKG